VSGGRTRIRTQSQRNDQCDKEHRRGDEAAARRSALMEMLRHERGVDAGAHAARDDQEITLHVGTHLTITLPRMSCEWSVQT
jgi:hypothetical protein